MAKGSVAIGERGHSCGGHQVKVKRILQIISYQWGGKDSKCSLQTSACDVQRTLGNEVAKPTIIVTRKLCLALLSFLVFN